MISMRRIHRQALQRGLVQEALVGPDDRNAGEIAVMQDQTGRLLRRPEAGTAVSTRNDSPGPSSSESKRTGGAQGW